MMSRDGWQRTIVGEINGLKERIEQLENKVSNDVRYTYDSSELWEIHVNAAISDVVTATQSLQSLSFIGLKDEALVRDPAKA